MEKFKQIKENYQIEVIDEHITELLLRKFFFV